MAYVNTTHTGNGVFANLLGTLRAAMAKQGQEMVKRRLYRITVQELSALSDRELGDLGIHRSQITAIAREGAYGIK